MASNRSGPCASGKTHRTGMALRLVLFAVAASCVSAFGVFPTAQTATTVVGTTVTSSKLNSPVASRQRHGILAARASGDIAEKISEDGGGSPALAVAVAGGSGRAGATSKAAVAASVQKAVKTASALQVDAAFDPELAAEEATKTRAQAVTTRAAKSVIRSLPGTWWTAGLPKWMHLVRRRMITKEDWMHLHAASGAIFLVGSSLYMLYIMGMELFAGVPQLDTTSVLPFCILGAGLLNTLSSIPMANTRSWVLTGLCTAVIQLWYPWYVSGAYPASLAPADPWLAAASLTVLVIACVEAEESIQAEKRARELVIQSGAKWKPTGQVVMRGQDFVEGDKMNRYGTLATLVFNVPHLYATLVGSGWVDRLAEAYPAAPALLFHAYFALVTSTSLALLAPTLYQRRLINVKELSAMQFLTAAPAVMSLIDAAVMGSAATNNPIEIYLGFLH